VIKIAEKSSAQFGRKEEDRCALHITYFFLLSWIGSSGYSDGGKHVLVGSFISTPVAVGAPDALNDFGHNHISPDSLHRALSHRRL
jgi:hypothetical protein